MLGANLDTAIRKGSPAVRLAAIERIAKAAGVPSHLIGSLIDTVNDHAREYVMGEAEVRDLANNIDDWM